MGFLAIILFCCYWKSWMEEEKEYEENEEEEEPLLPSYDRLFFGEKPPEYEEISTA